MDIKNFIENLADQFDDVSADSLTPDTVYKDLEEYGSMVALSIMAMVNEEYDVFIKGEDIRNTATIKDLFELVKSRKA